MSDSREELINVIWGQGETDELAAAEIADAVISWQAACAKSPKMGRTALSKIESLGGGDPVGLLVQNEAGAYVAVDVHGRFTWLDDEQPSSQDSKSLVRRLDIALNGMESAAHQASLSDIVAQVESAARAQGAELVGYVTKPVTRSGFGFATKERKQLNVGDAIYTRTQSAGVPEPDIFWDCDISEISHEDEYELADDCAQDLPYGESMLIDVMCAKQLPKRQMKVWINDEDEGLQWEWVQPPAGQEGE